VSFTLALLVPGFLFASDLGLPPSVVSPMINALLVAYAALVALLEHLLYSQHEGAHARASHYRSGAAGGGGGSRPAPRAVHFPGAAVAGMYPGYFVIFTSALLAFAVRALWRTRRLAPTVALALLSLAAAKLAMLVLDSRTSVVSTFALIFVPLVICARSLERRLGPAAPAAAKARDARAPPALSARVGVAKALVVGVVTYVTRTELPAHVLRVATQQEPSAASLCGTPALCEGATRCSRPRGADGDTRCPVTPTCACSQRCGSPCGRWRASRSCTLISPRRAPRAACSSSPPACP